MSEPPTDDGAVQIGSVLWDTAVTFRALGAPGKYKVPLLSGSGAYKSPSGRVAGLPLADAALIRRAAFRCCRCRRY